MRQVGTKILRRRWSPASAVSLAALVLLVATSWAVLAARSISSASSGGISVEVAVAHQDEVVGVPVEITVRARAAHAPGAMSYEVTFGDGTTESSPAPTVCAAGPGRAAAATWRLQHRYTEAGTFTVTATVRATCTTDRATAATRVRVR